MELTTINNQAINLIENKQILYNPIYSSKLVKLESLKTYVKNGLANEII